MNLFFSSYSLLVLIPPVVTAALAIYAWQHRAARGAVPLVLLTLSITAWSLGYALEIAGADLPTKLFWGKSAYLGIVAAPSLWLIFAVQYSNQGKWLTRRNVIALAIVPLITLSLVFTTEAHGLVWKQVYVNTIGDLSILGVVYGFWFWVHSAYSYILLLAGTLLISRSIISLQELYRGQSIALIVSVLAPWAGNILYLSGLGPIPGLDLTPFGFTVTVAALIWGVFRYKLIDLSPIARNMVIEEMRDSVLVLDAQNRITDLNPAAQRLLKLSASQAVGKMAAEVLSPWRDWVERFRDAQEASEEIVVNGEHGPHWHELRLSTLKDRHGHFVGRVIALRDITERKRMDEQLRQLSRAVESSPASIVITDAQANIEYVNPKFTQLTGYTLKEVLGKNPRFLKSTQTPPEVFHQLWESLSAKREWRGEFCNRKRNGELYWEFASISPILDAAGNTTHYIAVKEDITERKKNEAEIDLVLQQEYVLGSLLHLGLEDAPLEELLPKILREILSVHWMPLTPKGGIFLVEDKPDVLALQTQQNLPQTLQLICAHVAFGRCLCGRAAASRQIVFADCVDDRHENIYAGIVDHGHYTVPILRGKNVLGVIVLYLPAGHQKTKSEEPFLRAVASIVAGIVERKKIEGDLRHEVKERQQAEAALAIARDQALDASRFKSQMLAKVSHELRTPLTAILGYSELLEDHSYGNLTEEQQKVLGAILGSTRDLIELVSELLDGAQLEARALKLRPESFSPRKMLQDIESRIAVLAEKKGTLFTASISPDVPATLYCDETRLRQMLINLIGNAIKFTKEGSIQTRLYCPDTDHWAMEVADSGIGIPPEAQGYVFEAFRQVPGTEKRGRGAGLGLSIVKQLTELMGGEISLKSEVGKGSVFTITLPINRSSEMEMTRGTDK